MRAPFKGFLKNAVNNPNIALGKTLNISFSLEASGELFAPPGNNGTWASDTAAPIVSYFLGFPGVPGDYNNNGVVDAADYVLWRNGGPLQNDATPGAQSGDYDVWRAHFGQTSGRGSDTSSNAVVPEPATLVMLILAAAGLRLRRHRAIHGVSKLVGPVEKEHFGGFGFGLIFYIDSGLWILCVRNSAVLQEGGRRARSACIRSEGQGQH